MIRLTFRQTEGKEDEMLHSNRCKGQ